MADEAARLAALEQTVNDLRTEVEQLRAGRNHTMRQTHRCPSCGHTKLLYFRRIKDVAHGKTFDLSLQKTYSSWWGMQHSGGSVETFVCRNCRLVEWHATTLDDVQPDGEDIIEIDGAQRPMDPTPYR